ncbi:hypothetical protein [Kitasatospora sp. P5_F3]
MRPPPPDAGDESALAHAALVYQEWQRIRDEAATTGRETYDQDHDLGLRRAQTAARHRQDVADCVREATQEARLRTDAAHRQLAGAPAGVGRMEDVRRRQARQALLEAIARHHHHGGPRRERPARRPW